MPINDQRGNNGQQAQSAQAQSTTQSAAPQFNTQANGNRSWGSWMAREMPRDTASESIARIQNLLAENYASKANASHDYVTDVHILDNRTVQNLQIPSIIVATYLKSNVRSPVAYYALLCAAGLDNLRNRTETHSGNTIEVVSVHADAYNDMYRKAVQERMVQIYPTRTPLSADAMVIEKDFNPKEISDAYSLAAHAFTANTVKLRMAESNFNDLNLAQVGGDDVISFKAIFAASGTRSITNQPLRDDISIEINAVPPRQPNNQQSLQVEGGVQSGNNIATIRGYIELLPVSTPQQQNGYNVINAQKFKPRFVANNIDCQLTTPAAVLLSLVAPFTLFPNQRWLNTFRNRGLAAGEVNYNDIGILNIVANAYQQQEGGSAINTEAADFTANALWDYASRFIDKDPIISIDVDECGAQTYYMRLLAAAGEGDSAAIAKLYEAAQTLTNGVFGQKLKELNLQATMCPFINERSRIYLGKFADGTGNERDIRTIDYTAVLNATKRPDYAREFIETFLRSDAHPNLRAAARNKIYQDLLPQGYTITGTARRFTLRMDWFNALAAAMMSLGVVTRDETENSSGYFNAATADFLVTTPANVNGLFTQQGGNSFGFGATRLI